MNPFSLGRWFGVPVSIEPTAILVLLWFALSGAERGAAALFDGVVLGIGVFVSILVHEYGHVFAAKAFRLAPQEVILHGFGGLTRFLYEPKPLQGIVFSAAGPLAGAVFGAGLLFVPGLPVIQHIGLLGIYWSILNLLPLYPLDGGHILRHFLALFTHPTKARIWAARLAIPGWVLIGIWAVASGDFWMLIIVVLSLMRVVPAAGITR